MRIHIVNPVLPPQLDGIGDYTALISATLASLLRGEVNGGGTGASPITILTAQSEWSPIAGVPDIRTVFSPVEPKSVARIADVVRQDKPRWLLLQYNPFAYGRRGFNPYLPLMLNRLRRELPALRIAVMAHENYVPPISTAFRVMRLWQVPQFHALMRAAHVVFFSIETWADEWAKKLPGKPVHHLPVGSNIPLVATTRDAERARLGIPPDAFVIGAFGTSHVSRLFALMGDAVERVAAMERTGRPVVLLDVGPHAKPLIPVRAEANVRIMSDGPHSYEEVSRRFAAMDIYLNCYVDGISTRRGALMVGLQHGVPTAATVGINTDTLLKEADESAFLLSPVAQPERFAANVLRLHESCELRARVGVGGRDLYRKHLDWDVVARRTLHVLGESA